jgi:hypothetical protein
VAGSNEYKGLEGLSSPPKFRWSIQDWPELATRPLISFPGCYIFKEYTMKRILFAVVMAFCVMSAVGCGGGSSTTKPATPAK